MLRIVRHRLGLRVYLFRRRIHEWHLGLAVLAGAPRRRCGPADPVPALVIALVGLWLIAKDWSDLTRTRARRHFLAARAAPAALSVSAVASSRRCAGDRRRRRRRRRDRRPRLRGDAERLVARPCSRARRAARTYARRACARGACVVRAAHHGVLPLPAPLARASYRARAHGGAHGLQRRQGP